MATLIQNAAAVKAASTAIDAAIVAKGGTTEGGLTNAAAGIESISTGSGDKAPEKEVIFLGSEGEIIYSYTIAEAHALTALPPIPSVRGLKTQGWTHTLQEVNEAYGQLDVGSLWVTDNDTNRLTVEIPYYCKSIQIYLSQTVANGCTISWGDGVSDIMGSTSGTWYRHTYATGGIYDIEIKANSGILIFAYQYERALIQPQDSSDVAEVKTNNFLKKIYFADKNVSLQSRIFYGVTQRLKVFIPTNITSFVGYGFDGSQDCVIAHRNFTIPPDSFYGARRIVCWGTNSWMVRYNSLCKRFCFNGSPTGIDGYSFTKHYIYRLYFPPSLSTISCMTSSVAKLFDFTRHTSVPNLTNTHMSGANNYKIVVPDALYEDWIAATNWSSASIVSHIVKASEYEGE